MKHDNLILAGVGLLLLGGCLMPMAADVQPRRADHYTFQAWVCIVGGVFFLTLGYWKRPRP